MKFFAFIQGGVSGGLVQFLPTMVIFGLLLYFMIYRPQKKRQQNQQNLLDSLKVGDKIQTIGGFIGEIVDTDNDEFIIESASSKLRIKRSAVALKVGPHTVELETPKKETAETDDEDFNIDDFEI